MRGARWGGAVAFATWLGEKEGVPPAYNLTTWELIDTDPMNPGVQITGGLRLPSEAEWECAAAWNGSKHWVYGFAADALSGSDRCNYYLGSSQYVNPLGLINSTRTAPVGWFDGVHVSPNGNVQTVDSPSPVGCYDMSGGAREWCHDRYDSDFYSGGAVSNPLGASTGNARVLRGGSWDLLFSGCRTADRRNRYPRDTWNFIGFRICRSLTVP